MKNTVLFLYLFSCCFFTSCGKSTDTEKKQTNRNKITDVNDKVVEIIKDDAIIGSNARLYLTEDYLIIKDSQSYDMMV